MRFNRGIPIKTVVQHEIPEKHLLTLHTDKVVNKCL